MSLSPLPPFVVQILLPQAVASSHQPNDYNIHQPAYSSSQQNLLQGRIVAQTTKIGAAEGLDV